METPKSRLEKFQQIIHCIINDFLCGKIDSKQCKELLYNTKESFISNSPKQEGAQIGNLISIEQALLQGSGILDENGIEVNDFAMLLKRLQSMKLNQLVYGDDTKFHQVTREVLSFVSSSQEAKQLGIQISQIDGVLLPPDNIAFPEGNGIGTMEKTNGGFNKVKPLMEVMNEGFGIDCADATQCQGWEGIVNEYSSRKESYLALIFPGLVITILINNRYGQGVYILDGCVDSELLCEVTKQGRKKLQSLPNNPQKFTAYHIPDSFQITEIIKRKSAVRLQIEKIIQTRSVLGADQNNEDNNDKRKIFTEYFYAIGYDELMGYSQEQINALCINIGTGKFRIISIAKILGNDNRKWNPLSPYGFQQFITQFFEKPRISDVLKESLEKIGYEELMGYSDEQINAICLNIGKGKFGIVSIAKKLGNDNKICSPATPFGFQQFITKLFERQPITDVLKETLEKIGYEELMGYSYEQIRALNVQIGKGSFSIGKIATMLGNDNKICNPNTPFGFQQFITTLFEKQPIADVLKETLEKIGYEELMGYSDKQIDAFSVQIGKGQFWISSILTILGNDNKKLKPLTKFGFQQFITKLFNKKPINYVLKEALEKIGYEKLVGYSSQQIRALNVQIGKGIFSICTIATILGNDNKKLNPQIVKSFRQFIHYIVFQKKEPLEE